MDWRWYSSPNTVRLYIHCLMRAYYKDTERLDMKIPAGSFETSYGKLARELRLTEKQIRTALFNLKKTGEVSVRPTQKCSIITVVGFVEDQQEDNQNGTKKTVKSHSEGTQRATNIEINKNRKEIKSWKI